MKNALEIIAAVLILLICAGFGGCTDRTELGNRAIIQALAVDHTDCYRVSALMFSSGGGSDRIDASQDNVIKVTGEGRTISEALNEVSLIDGKRVYMSETKLLILGGGFERESALDMLETLYYDMRCSLGMPVCCVGRGDRAEFVTDLKFTEGITSAEKPLSLIENGHRMGVSPKTTLLDLLADSAGGKASLLPMLKEAKNGRGMTADDDRTAVLCGSRVFENGLLGAPINEKETASLMRRGK